MLVMRFLARMHPRMCMRGRRTLLAVTPNERAGCVMRFGQSCRVIECRVLGVAYHSGARKHVGCGTCYTMRARAFDAAAVSAKDGLRASVVRSSSQALRAIPDCIETPDCIEKRERGRSPPFPFPFYSLSLLSFSCCSARVLEREGRGSEGDRRKRRQEETKENEKERGEKKRRGKEEEKESK